MLFECSCRHVKIGHIDRIYPPWLLWNRKDQGTEPTQGYAGQTGNERLQGCAAMAPRTTHTHTPSDAQGSRRATQETYLTFARTS